jgi:Fe-S cluster biogenesis protein NfuA
MAPRYHRLSSKDVVLAEHTPNPDCLKLHTGRPLGVPHGVDFTQVEAATASPLAARLFALSGVRRVFLGLEFVAVTKDPGVPWRPLGERAIEAVRDWLASGEPALAADFAPTPPSSDDPDAARVREIVERDIRPLVARDGGDVVFVTYRAGIAELVLRGACADCPSAARTLAEGIEARLRELVPDFIGVVAR